MPVGTRLGTAGLDHIRVKLAFMFIVLFQNQKTEKRKFPCCVPKQAQETNDRLG
jgi:hypothetical protein